ncbi:ribonuclease HII [Geojedonia litorea]|uniref:Ribonuclease HII n=1 Tax=Geojedonia litorea TaxID=1268269 RepID=A0ABV9N248_9FLAO
MKYALVCLLLCFCLTGCDNRNKKSTSLLAFSPETASIFIKANSLENISSVLINNDLLKASLDYNTVSNLQKKLEILSYLNSENPFLIALVPNNQNSPDFTFATKLNANILSLDSLPNLISEKLELKKYTVDKTTIDKDTIYSTVIDSIFVGSNTLALLEQAINKKQNDPELESIFKTSSSERSLSIVLNLKAKNLKPSFFYNDQLNAHQFSNYMLLDVDVSQNNIIFNGVTKATDSTKSWINIFKNTIPQENSLSQIAPNDADHFISYTYNNFRVFNENIQNYRKQDSIVPSPIFVNSVEVGSIKLNGNKVAVIKSIDAELTLEGMDTPILVETFRDVNIYDFDTPEIFEETFSPFINFNSALFYAVIDNFFVFAETTDILKGIISNYQNKTTISNSSHFKSVMNDLSDASSVFVYANQQSLNNILNQNFNEVLSPKLEAYKASCLQFVYETDFAHVNGAFKTFKSTGANNTVVEALDIKIDASLLTAPQLVINHTNNQKDIVVQDINNNLYLISNEGKIFWKKQLDGKVLGTIEQMDIYKNGRLQLVFATPHRVYVLDRNGKDVGPFPLKFNDKITQSLSLFDYDSNKNYRLLVTQGKSLLMYDKQGKAVTGFRFNSTNETISSQPKHFRIGNKDYIVFTQGKQLRILDRTGKTRIDVKETFDFSTNEIYLYNNNFTTTNTNGTLIQVNQRGQVSQSNINISDDHFICSTSRTLVTLFENKLTIKSHVVELDFGEYLPPQIFYINDKIYVTTTDLQSNKVYLFDSLGKPIANFPVYGNSSITLDNIDKDRNLELVVKGDDSDIIVYEIN